MKLLYLSRWLPYPASNGIKLRIYNLIKRLAERGHSLHLITFYEQGEDPQAAIDHLGQFCSTVECIPYRPFQPDYWKAKLAFFSDRPRSVIVTFVPELAEHVETLLKAGQVDLVIASEIDMAEYGLLAEKYNIPALLEELEVGTVYDYCHQRVNLKAMARRRLTWFKQARYVRFLARHYQTITVVSPREQEIMQRLTGQTLPILPNGADLSTCQFHPYRPDERANQLVFNGALSYGPNYEAACYFLAEIFPLVRQTRPDMKLLITGRYDKVDLSGLKQGKAELPEGASLTGFVDDIQALLNQSKACIVPLLGGGGTRLKILEAFALGTPVVSTSKGAEGIEARHNEHLLIADTPQAFAEAILRLDNEPGLAERLARQARVLVESRYDWDGIAAKLDELLVKLGQSLPHSSLPESVLK